MTFTLCRKQHAMVSKSCSELTAINLIAPITSNLLPVHVEDYGALSKKFVL